MTGRQIESLRDALCSAFDQDALDQMLRLRLDKDRAQLAGSGSLRTVVFKVIEVAVREGWQDKLVRAAIAYNPGNAALQRYCEKHPALVGGPAPAVKPPHLLPNPLHRIIDLLIGYHRALGRLHHANTQETRLSSLREWRSCHPAVWENRSARDDTIRTLADPAKEWLSQIKCPYVHVEDFNLVEECVRILSAFAVSPSPMAMPGVYSKTFNTEDKLWQRWDKQGDGYIALGGLIARLKELLGPAR